VRIGSQRPRFQNLPVDRHSSAGTEAVDLAAMAGLVLDDWQAWFLSESLSETRRGQWSAAEVALIVTRQNGKGSVLEARQLAGLFLLGDRLQVHTAHEFKTCYEHFLRVVALIESSPDLDRLVMRVRRGAGDQAIELKSGARLRFLARSAGSGRGMSGDVVYLDEAFALTNAIMGALLPVLSARSNPQVWYTSSAPKVGSDVLHGVLRRGREGAGKRLLYAEWSVDPDRDPADRDGWYESNPALGIRISEQAVETEFEAMSDMPAEFARERLGVPDEPDGVESVVPVEQWNALWAKYDMTGACRLAFDVSADGKWASVCAAQTGPDGIDHLEVVDRRPGTEWLDGRVIELCRRLNVGVSVATNGPGIVHAAAIVAAGVTVVEVGPTDLMRAAAGFVDACANRRLRHRGDPAMLAAITGAATKRAGDLWSWGRASSSADITPLVACSLALASVVARAPMFAY